VPSVGRLRYLEALPPGSVRARGTLLLLHAFPLNARMWEPQLPLSEHGWRVIAPHYRGMDGATADPAAASVEDYAADVFDLLDRLHIDEAVITGLSLGGYVAFALFRHAPRYFQGLVLADTRSQADTPEAVENRKRMIALAQQKGPAAIADEMIPKLLGDTTRSSHPDVVERVRSLIRSSSSAAISGAITALMTRPDSTPVLASIHCPTMILVGEEDTLTPIAMSRDLQRDIAGSELAVIRKAGHLASLEQPAAFNAELARFLEHRV
jgi:pimeloyl-ACP methyl ester carboxylesterase